jgi:protein gp37
MRTTSIEWTDKSHNFWHGCTKISSGCKFCYMFRDKDKYKQDGSEIRRLSDQTFYSPLSIHEPKRVFINSYSDFFIEEADSWRADAWEVIRDTPHLTWQILTKRPERILECLPDDWGNEGYPNVWLGVSIEEQMYFHRAETLAKIPAAVRFISAEPLLEELDMLVIKNGKRIIDDFHWVVVGGESGNEYGPHRYRPSEISWYERIVQDLKSQTNVAVFMKQLGSHLRKTMRLKHYHGGELAEWPSNLQIREFPQ